MTAGGADDRPDSREAGREERIAEVLAGCSDRLAAGQLVDSAQVLEQHQDLRPELEWALRALLDSTLDGDRDSCLDPRLQTLGGHRILGEIGRGGMGIVYDAVELTLGRRVALKVLPLPPLAQGDRRERFLREARAAARLHHTRIVPIHEVGEESGVLYYTMQHISGCSLDRVLRSLGLRSRGGAPAAGSLEAAIVDRLLGGAGVSAGGPGYHNSVARLGAEMASALEHAHREGVLHRDVKPSNIIVDTEGAPWLTDFGLAKLELESHALTRAGDVVGTIAYMAPERLAGEGDARSDVYSLGATLYELLALRPPFQDTDRSRLLQAVENGAAPRPRSLDSTIPRDLETIVLKAMARDVGHRYGSAAALGQDLERFLRSEPIAARRVGPVARLALWCRRHSLVASLLGLVTTLLVALLVVLLVSSHRLREQLLDAELARARALLVSGQPGRRFESLAAIERAAEIASNDARPVLRDLALQALSLADVRETLRQAEPLLERMPSICDPEVKRYAVLAADRGSVLVRELAGGKQLQLLPGGAGVESFAGWSAGGGYLAAHCKQEGRHSVRIWRLADASVWMEVEGGDAASPVDFDSEREVALVTRRDGSIATIDLDTREEIRSWKPSKRPSGLELEPAGRRVALAVAGTPTIEIVDLDVNVRLSSIETAGSISALSWCPRSSLIATASLDEEHILLWNADQGETVGRLEGHNGAVVRLSFSPGGEILASASWDGTLRLWDPWNRDLLVTLAASGSFSGFSRDGTRMATLGPGVVLSDVALGKERLIHRSLRAPSVVGGQDQCFHPGGRLLLRHWDLWDAHLSCEVSRDGPWPTWSCAVFTPSGDALVLSTESGIALHSCDLTSEPGGEILHVGRQERQLDIRPGAGVLALDGAGRRLAATEPGGTIVLLDLKGSGERVVLGIHREVDQLSMSSDGKYLASGTTLRGRGVKVWDLDGLLPPRDLEESRTGVARFSPRGEWIGLSFRNEITVLRVGSWSPLRSIQRAPGSELIGPIAWHPDGRRLALAITQSDVVVLDVETGDTVGRFSSGPLRRLQAITFSPDGGLLALGRDNATTEIWDLRHMAADLDQLGLAFSGARLPEPTKESAVHPLRAVWSSDALPGGEPADTSGDVEGLPLELLRDELRLHLLSERMISEGRWKASLRLRERAREASPGSASAANNLAWALITCPEPLRDPGRALTLSEEAVRLEPRTTAFLNTLGVAQYRVGNFAQAIDTLLASSRGGGEVTAWDGLFLSMALKRQGLDALAEDYYVRALRWIERHHELRGPARRELRAFTEEAASVQGAPRAEAGGLNGSAE